jgi:hypothetical protein
MGTTVLVTEDTLEHAGSSLSLLVMCAIRVVGKKKPVRLFRLSFEEPNPEMRAAWEKALELWSARSWSEARAAFTKVMEQYPDLAVATETYLEALAELEKNPPGPEWQGELAMDHK